MRKSETTDEHRQTLMKKGQGPSVLEKRSFISVFN